MTHLPIVRIVTNPGSTVEQKLTALKDYFSQGALDLLGYSLEQKEELFAYRVEKGYIQPIPQF